MSPDKLKYYKNLLLENKKQLFEESDSSFNTFAESDRIIGDDIDQANALYTERLLKTLSDSQQKQMELIDKALHKIEIGTYGICEATKKPIEEERLEAIPYTPYCMSYANTKMKKRRMPLHKRTVA